MKRPIVQTATYRSVRDQTLHNVLVYAPTIIWIQSGMKQLYWRDQNLVFDHSQWLIIPANQYLSFINIPAQQGFFSKALTLIEPPPRDWLEFKNDGVQSKQPKIVPSSALKYGFEQLFQMENHALDSEAQKHLLLSFYAQLKAENKLHLLFPSHADSLQEKLSVLISATPGESHNVESAAASLNMSRATLIRKLSAEDTSFRKILTEVRMGYALSLMQEGKALLDVSLACGYQSQARFSARFKQQFKVTPSQYIQTLNQPRPSNKISGKLLTTSK